MSTTTALDDYRYRPLDTQTPEFRLLRLRKGGDTIKIECEIFHAVISDHDGVSYEALSYAWGNAELVFTVEVDSQKLWITESLYSALHCLRYHDQDRILWIDAICINQSDEEEQSRQVLEMGKIYSFARRVIFWLGMPTAEAIFSMNCLCELQMKIATLVREGKSPDYMTCKALWSSIGQPQKPGHVDRLTWQQEGLKVLFKRPWFERVWILQEVLNARSAIVCSGVLCVSTTVFSMSPLLVGVRPQPHVQAVLDIMPAPAKTESQQNRRRDKLVNLYDKFRTSKATDKRDMVFALLNMSSEPLDHGLLCPDYTKSIQKVVRDTLRYLIEEGSASMSQAIRFVADFETVRVTYLTSVDREAPSCEDVSFPSQSRPYPFRSIRDISLFRFDKRDSEHCGRQVSLHAELDLFQSELDRYSGLTNHDDQFIEDDLIPWDRECRTALYIDSWQEKCENLKLVFLTDAARALLLVGWFECWQMFHFILDGGADSRSQLLRDALHEAAVKGYHDAVMMLLKKGAHVDACGGTYGTALQAASIGNSLAVVKLLLAKGANVNQQGGKYGTALQAASMSGNTRIVELLLERGADINASGGEYGTALQAAAMSGYLWIVELLLDKGADVNVSGVEYGTALQAAIAGGHRHIADQLLKKGADVNAQGGKHGNALQAASVAPKNREEIIQLLVEYGAQDTRSAQEYLAANRIDDDDDAPRRATANVVTGESLDLPEEHLDDTASPREDSSQRTSDNEDDKTSN